MRVGDSAAGVMVTRAASPPSLAEAAKTSPRAVNATLRPSGESTRSPNWVVSRRCSTAGPAGAPIRAIGNALVRPLATSSFQIPKLRSNTTTSPRSVIDGHSTRPSLKRVSWRGVPAATDVCQMFSAPPRSET